MNTIIAYPNNLDFSNGNYHQSSDNFKKANKFLDFNEFQSLTHKDTFIYLIPSSIIGNYVFESNKNLSKQNNLANFISEIDTYIVSDISKNEFFISDQNGFVIDKSLYKKINNLLNSLNCKVIAIPDYFLNNKTDKDTITEFNDNFLFSFKDGTGGSIDHDSLKQYLDTVKSSHPDFNPDVFSDKNIKELQTFNINKNIKVPEFLKNMKPDLPNLFKFKFTIKNIFNKLSFSRTEMYLCILLLVSCLSLPHVFIAQNNKHINIYESETFNIFRSIDKNTKKIVTPKLQMDQLVEQISVSSLVQAKDIKSNFANFRFLISIGDDYLNNVQIDFNSNEATLSFINLPDLQYRLLKNSATSFNIEILNEDILNNENKINGQIKIGFNNE
jgi:hypothetical protein